MYYLAPACFLFLSAPCVFLEAPRLMHDTEAVTSVTVLLCSAVAAFALNLSIYMLIGEVRVAALAPFLLAIGCVSKELVAAAVWRWRLALGARLPMVHCIEDPPACCLQPAESALVPLRARRLRSP
jgi:hypothetical protein